MAHEAAKLQRKEKAAAPVKLVSAADLLDQLQAIHESLARRAFEIFEGKGWGFGQELDNWFQAESELLHPSHIDLAESDDAFTVRAEVPGFAADELNVSLEGRQLTITGKRKTKEERTDERTVYYERCSDQVMRIVELPADVTTETASASLADGILEVKMPKASPATKIPVTS